MVAQGEQTRFCRALAENAIQVSMTRKAKSKTTKSEATKSAKSRRRTRDRRPGRDEVVAVAAEEFRRLSGNPTGEALIAAMRASPYRDIDIEPRRAPMPVRDVAL
jgi:hypothetical protein